MAVIVSCPNPSCGRRNRFDDGLGGSLVCCPVCGERFTLVGSTVAHLRSQEFDLAPETVELTTMAEIIPDLPHLSEMMPDHVDRYLVKRIVGSGAFGNVYLAYDPQLDRNVALKIPHEGVLESPSAVERFQREARSAARLRHGSIVPVYDAGRDDEGLNYIASAFVAGSTLSQLISEGPLPIDRAAEIIIQLADALEHAHESGVVHRDVKPGNVLIDSRGNPLLTDFGLAQHRGPTGSTITEVGTVMGTPGYMAPEVAVGVTGDVPPASDQYGLGVILYEMICGQRPFQGPSHVVIYRKIEEDPPPLCAKCPDLDERLEAICLRALARSPEDRYSSCGQFAESLRDWLTTRSFSINASPQLDSAFKLSSESPPHVSQPRRKAHRKSRVRQSSTIGTILVTLFVWGLITLGVVLLIQLLSD